MTMAGRVCQCVCVSTSMCVCVCCVAGFPQREKPLLPHFDHRPSVSSSMLKRAESNEPQGSDASTVGQTVRLDV